MEISVNTRSAISASPSSSSGCQPALIQDAQVTNDLACTQEEEEKSYIINVATENSFDLLHTEEYLALSEKHDITEGSLFHSSKIECEEQDSATSHTNKFVNCQLRRKNTQIDSDASENDSDNSYMQSSLPIMTVNNEIAKLKQKLEDLTSQMKGAEIEIEKLLMENSNLKKELEKSWLAQEYLKEITTSIHSTRTPSSTKSLRKKPKANKSLRSPKESNCAKVLNFKPKKQVNASSQTEVFVESTKDIIIFNETSNLNSNIQVEKVRKQEEDEFSFLDQNIQNSSPKNKQMNKMCIISSNNKNKVLLEAEKTFSGYKVCHYLKTNCGIKELLLGLESKLIDFTMKVILILKPQMITMN
ncbi:hypothetical protein O0L34_g15903 [Tuta absoluta]|nr:hypothetical protein O0L34_g15903 [Tuta absoluta]